MRTSVKFTAIAALALIVVVFSNCSKNDSKDNNGPISTIVTSGVWKVTLFSERGNNETSDFNVYEFIFASDGTFMADKNGNMQHGTWSENTSSNKLIIDIGPKQDSNKPLGELTDDWVVISSSSNKISLTDNTTSREELLEFTKK